MRADQRNGAPCFDLDQIEAMHIAFQRACTRMRLRGSKAAPIIERVAIKIVELAKSGQLDPDTLTEAVLADFGVVRGSHITSVLN